MSVIGSILIMVVPMLIGMIVAAVFVYMDAKKRNMNEIIWALVAFFVPFFIGVIVYLAIREPITQNVCPVCGEEIGENAGECGKCNTILMTACNKCGFPIKKDWKACPSCGNELPENYNQPVTKYKKESGIIAIAIVIAILVLGFVAVNYLGAFLFATNTRSSSSSGYSNYTGMYNITKEDLSNNSHIAKWISESDKNDSDVAVLMSKAGGVCIVYIKDNDQLIADSMELDYIDVDTEYEEFVVRLNLDESGYEDKYGYDFFVYEMEILDDAKFTAYKNGEEQKVKVTYIEEDISISTWEVE